MIDRFGQALVDWILPINAWTAALLACALLVDRTLARRAGASLRVALYAPVALRAALPLSWSIPLAHVPGLPADLPLAALSASGTAGGAVAVPWRAGVALAYVAIAATLVLRSVVQRRTLARALASARPANLPTGEALPCPVLAHRALGPMVVGLFAPRIVPEGMVDGPAAGGLACVLRHEAAHVRRADPWTSTAVEGLVAVLWPVAPLWIAAARVRALIAGVRRGRPGRRRRGRAAPLRTRAPRGRGAGIARICRVRVAAFGSTLRARVDAIAIPRPWPRAAQASAIAAAVATFLACSSAGTSALPEATGGARSTARSASQDDGYRHETDPLVNASRAEAAPPATTNEEGRVAPEVIQSVVRESFGLFRGCYEAGVQRNAKLEGTVTVEYVINEDGTVRDAAEEQSTLPDPDVVQCVVRGFGGLVYPPPKDGFVTVIYPIRFAPGS